MPENGVQFEQMSEARLAFFIDDRLLPVLKKVESGRSLPEVEENFIWAEVLESFLWLHHGVDIEYFPLTLSRRVIYEYFHLFLKAYERVSSGRYFETWFTPPIRGIWASEFTGKQALFSAGRTWERSKARSEADLLFQPLLVLSNGFAQNPAARPFIQALLTSNETVWQQSFINNVPIAPVDLPNNEDGGNASFSSSMDASFFAVLDYMQAYRRLNFDLKAVFPNMDKDLQDYLRLLKETQQWRLNCGYPEFRERLIQAGRRAAKNSIEHLSKEETLDSGAMEADFIKSLMDLMTDWGSPLSKAIGA